VFRFMGMVQIQRVMREQKEALPGLVVDSQLLF
jgi:hypothetical protein